MHSNACWTENALMAQWTGGSFVADSGHIRLSSVRID